MSCWGDRSPYLLFPARPAQSFIRRADLCRILTFGFIGASLLFSFLFLFSFCADLCYFLSSTLDSARPGRVPARVAWSAPAGPSGFCSVPGAFRSPTSGTWSCRPPASVSPRVQRWARPEAVTWGGQRSRGPGAAGSLGDLGGQRSWGPGGLGGLVALGRPGQSRGPGGLSSLRDGLGRPRQSRGPGLGSLGDSVLS